jgi:hypothetical protein
MTGGDIYITVLLLLQTLHNNYKAVSCLLNNKELFLGLADALHTLGLSVLFRRQWYTSKHHPHQVDCVGF